MCSAALQVLEAPGSSTYGICYAGVIWPKALRLPATGEVVGSASVTHMLHSIERKLVEACLGFRVHLRGGVRFCRGSLVKGVWMVHGDE